VRVLSRTTSGDEQAQQNSEHPPNRGLCVFYQALIEYREFSRISPEPTCHYGSYFANGGRDDSECSVYID
jgi:hypothetical protein